MLFAVSDSVTITSLVPLWCRRALLCLAILSAAIGSARGGERLVNSKPHFQPLDSVHIANVFRWTDTCNVYVVRDGDTALLIDLGDGSVLDLFVRNFESAKQAHRIEIHAPPGLAVEPPVLEGHVAGESRRAFPIRVRAERTLAPGVRIVGVDVTIDGKRYGERFDFVVGVGASPAQQQ